MPTRYLTTRDGQTIPDPRGTQAWRRLAKQVAREEPICWLNLDGCTQVSTTGDHLTPVTDAPELALVRTNIRGACSNCNYRRGNLPTTALNLKPPSAALSIFDRP